MEHYDDNYATCIETYATLRVYSNELSLAKISDTLGAEPTQTHAKGDLNFTKKDGTPKYYEMNNWFYSSKGLVDSRDCRRHIDWIIDNAAKDVEAVRILSAKKCFVEVSVFYVYLQGGPTLSKRQMAKLAERDINISWDLFHTAEDE